MTAALALLPWTSRSCFRLQPKSLELMSESQTPADTNDLARLRVLVTDYETRLTDAAALVARVRHEINAELRDIQTPVAAVNRAEE